MKYLFYTLLLLFSFNLFAQKETLLTDPNIEFKNSLHSWRTVPIDSIKPIDNQTLDLGPNELYLSDAAYFTAYPYTDNIDLVVDTVYLYEQKLNKISAQLATVQGKLNQITPMRNLELYFSLVQQRDYFLFSVRSFNLAETIYFDPYTVSVGPELEGKCVAVKDVDLSYEAFINWKYLNN